MVLFCCVLGGGDEEIENYVKQDAAVLSIQYSDPLPISMTSVHNALKRNRRNAVSTLCNLYSTFLPKI